jgi:uncharacterized protein (DUF2252 family)
MSLSLATRLLRFNADREPERIAIKYAAMRADPFAFFRGTAHLFYDDWPRRSLLDRTPLTWACGDLHLENFGSYKGSNGLAYFDLNDFDEAALAPAGRDLTRLATSTLLAGRQMKLPAAEARSLWSHAHVAYAQALRGGKAMWVERATAQGLVKQLLRSVKDRTQAQLLNRRTRLAHGRRRIRIDGVHALALSEAGRAMVIRAIGRTHIGHLDPKFFEVIDAARRVAGTGSLGVHRFTVLVRGHGGRNGNVLLDLKQAAPSCLASSMAIRQPQWSSEADRVVTTQRRVQAASPALLHAVALGRNSYILRELQPVEDRLALARARDKPRRLSDALCVMADVVAWGQLRSSGRQGSATADELIDFGCDESWVRPLMDYSRYYTDVVYDYWQEFARGYDDGLYRASS